MCKTYIIRHVGQKLFENYIELNLVEDYVGARLFANAKTVEDFYLAVSMLAGDRMKEKENTLIFIDEIQAYPHLLTLLKFLAQDDRFTYIASGSLLGVTLAQTTSIPMGSIRMVRMFPLDFEEFLYANGMNALVVSSLRKKYERQESLDEATSIAGKSNGCNQDPCKVHAFGQADQLHHERGYLDNGIANLG